MPTRPLSHEARMRQRHGPQRNYAEEESRRMQSPALALAKRIRSSARWQHVRALKLAQDPLCEDPYQVHARSGYIEVAGEVDHVVGLAQRPDLAYTLENLASLCVSCHARKSAGERHERGRPST